MEVSQLLASTGCRGNRGNHLALSVRADVLLMDERRGREGARQFGLAVAGVSGELLHPRQIGLLPDLRSETCEERLGHAIPYPRAIRN